MDRIPPIQNQKLESLKIFQKSFILGTHFLGPMLKSKLTDKHLAHIACKIHLSNYFFFIFNYSKFKNQIF